MAKHPKSKARVLVTGANRGMGLGYVRHYLEQGWQVVATVLKPDRADALGALQDAFGERLMVESLDVACEESIAGLAERLSQQGLAFDLVINNAGISAEEAFGEWTAANFQSHFLVNFTGPALVAQSIAPLMNAGAQLVNISSGMGSAELNINAEGPLDAYAVSKAALNLLTRRLAEKLRPKGIGVVAVNPGWVQTDMGGQEAPLSIDQAIARLTSLFAGLTLEQSGSFLSDDGQTTPW